jgi:hypothetical protein
MDSFSSSLIIRDQLGGVSTIQDVQAISPGTDYIAKSKGLPLRANHEKCKKDDIHAAAEIRW